MISAKGLYISENEYKKEHVFTNSENIIKELGILEYRINAIALKEKNRFQFNFLKSSIKDIKNLLKRIIRKQKMNCINRRLNFGEIGYKNSIKIDKVDIHNEIQLLAESLLRIKKACPNIQEHTDIINIYWHSKEKFEIIEKVDNCVQKLGIDIIGLEV